MAHGIIDRRFYDAVLNFESSDTAQDYYYKVMDSETGKTDTEGRPETIRKQILRVYAMLFCDDCPLPPGYVAGVEDVENTADRLHTENMGYDRKHWYRMRHHFPVIDEDNYDRFAALVIADLNAGELREAAEKGYDMLLVGEKDPLRMTEDQRRHQKVRVVNYIPGEDRL